MPWSTPTLRDVRSLVRDDITAAVSGVRMVGNSVLRVMADANAGLAHLTLRYIDWLARQFLPDTAEQEWLDRHGDIWLVNADGTVGRKGATFASGSATFTGFSGTVIPKATQLTGQGADADGTYVSVTYETTEEIIIGTEATPCGVVAIDAGVAGNLDANETLTMVASISGVDNDAIVVSLTGGTDEENDDDLRLRVLMRIRQPPMGGASHDYVEWALSYPGVTRAWVAPLEMGIGCITVRFMMDDLRSNLDGFPTVTDVADLETYLNTVRPVAVKDFFCEAPLPFSIDFTISGLSTNDESTRAAITEAVKDMLRERAKPGQTIYYSWLNEAISSAIGEDHHELIFTTAAMPAPGYIAVLGTITYE